MQGREEVGAKLLVEIFFPPSVQRRNVSYLSVLLPLPNRQKRVGWKGPYSAVFI